MLLMLEMVLRRELQSCFELRLSAYSNAQAVQRTPDTSRVRIVIGWNQRRRKMLSGGSDE